MSLQNTRQVSFDTNVEAINMWGADSESTLMEDTVKALVRLCVETGLIHEGDPIPDAGAFIIAYSTETDEVGIAPAWPFNPGSIANANAQSDNA